MEQIKFSFIIPVYNVENYITRCIESIYGQSYSNYEVICVNDGSTDHSLNVLQSLKSKYDTIFIVNQSNQGLGAARNEGMKYVTGDYIWFVDSDDWIEKDALMRLNEAIRKFGKREIILFDYFISNGIKDKIYQSITKEQRIEISGIEYTKSLLLYNGIFAACLKIFRADTFISHFKFGSGFYEDIPLISFYYQINTCIVYLHKPLYYYFRREDSITQTFDNRILDIYNQFDKVESHISKEKELSRYFQHFFYYISVVTFYRSHNAPLSVRKNLYTIFHTRKKYIPFFPILFFKDISLKRKIKLLANYLSMNFMFYKNIL